MLAVNGETKEEHFFLFFLLKRFYFLVVFPGSVHFPEIFGENFWRLCELVGLFFSPLKLQELEVETGK